MIGNLSGWDDTIIAVATPPGIGAIGVVRLSGDKAIEAVNSMFPSKNLEIQGSHTLHVGFLKQGETVLDEVVVSLYKQPRSYTGEDVVEISCHGSSFVIDQVMAACTDHGVRLAKPGEFTQRAFLNGKLDLAQAESVADLIASNSAASRNAALRQMRGGLSKDLKWLREELIRFSALIELELDFSQEDVEFFDRTQFNDLITQLSRATRELILSFKLGNAIKNGVQVAIIGKPNAGKSTLLNALLKEERAIVSEIAGTTRDTIEEVLNINGILFRLIDTAGIRQHSSDTIEMLGIGKSRDKMEEAGLILFIEDATAVPAQKDALQAEVWNAAKPVVHIINKSDLLTPEERSLLLARFPTAVFTTAKEQRGIEEIKTAIYGLAISGELESENTIITNARHYAALQKVAESLAEVKVGIDNRITGDLLALDIRQCLHYLGEITGQITHEDQLDFIFSKFCIGK